jgi:probable phosphoglycerate mutase
MKLVIIRHGETEENKRKIIQGHTSGTLTDKGQIEDAMLGELLSELKPHHIYTSDLGRALGTAKAVHKHHPGIDLKIEPLLRERAYGSAQGKTYGECGFDGVPEMAWTPEGGETLEDLLSRAEEFLRGLKSKHNQDETIFIVSHGLLIMALLSHILEKDFGDVNADLPKNSSAKLIELLDNDVKEIKDISAKN